MYVTSISGYYRKWHSIAIWKSDIWDTIAVLFRRSVGVYPVYTFRSAREYVVSAVTGCEIELGERSRALPRNKTQHDIERPTPSRVITFLNPLHSVCLYRRRRAGPPPAGWHARGTHHTCRHAGRRGAKKKKVHACAAFHPNRLCAPPAEPPPPRGNLILEDICVDTDE